MLSMGFHTELSAKMLQGCFTITQDFFIQYIMLINNHSKVLKMRLFLFKNAFVKIEGKKCSVTVLKSLWVFD